MRRLINITRMLDVPRAKELGDESIERPKLDPNPGPRLVFKHLPDRVPVERSTCQRKQDVEVAVSQRQGSVSFSRQEAVSRSRI